MPANNKKYALIKDDCVYKYFDGKTILLFRIQALKDITCIDYASGRVIIVVAGDRGGYIESEDCLSQDGTCWVHTDSYVYGGGKVWNDAQVLPGSDVMGDVVKGYTTVDKHTIVCKRPIGEKEYVR